MDNVAAVMSVMKRRWDTGLLGGGSSLADHLDVPLYKQVEIRQQHRSLPQRQIALARYSVDYLPQFSWSTLAGALYHCEEEAALQAARRYIKREEGKVYNGMVRVDCEVVHMIYFLVNSCLVVVINIICC